MSAQHEQYSTTLKRRHQ